jgi:hypothetical protein
MEQGSRAPPFRLAAGFVFQHDALIEQFFADAVGLGEVFGGFGGDAGSDLRFDSAFKTE